MDHRRESQRTRRVAGFAVAALLAAVAAGAQPRIATVAPPEAPSRLALVGEEEPGEPLIVSGTVYGAGGEPLAGASVFVYQTGADGIYGPQGNADPRIRGYLRTDGEGRYEFRTVRPGSYPGRRIAPHIHIHVAPPRGDEQQIKEIVFAGDPYVTERMRESSFFVVRTLEEGEDGVLRCTHDVRLKTE